MADPVLIHAGNARKAGRKWGIPASVILGILSVEGGTSSTGKPVAPEDGAGPPSYGQFTYGTGADYHVTFGDSASETDAIGHYLSDLGYSKDPRKAIASYNGGPNNPQYGYADKVLAAAKRYTGVGGTTTSTTAPATSSGTASTTTSSSSGGGLFGQTERSGAVRALTYTAFSVGGLVLVGLGISRALGLKLSSPLTLQGQLLGKA